MSAMQYGVQGGYGDQRAQGGVEEMEFDFSPKVSGLPPDIRMGFIRKVYSLLSIQLLVTAVICAFIIQQPKEWVVQNFHVAMLANMVVMGTMLGVMCCCQSVTRQFPHNYIFLAVVTVGIGITTGFVASMYTTQSVLVALFATCWVFFGLTAYACTTKSDFTGMGPCLMAALLALIGFAFAMSLVSFLFGATPGPLVHKLFALAGTVIFSMYVVYDTQLIVGGSHKHEFSVDDYVFAALNIYLDVINLFLYILRLMGDRR